MPAEDVLATLAYAVQQGHLVEHDEQGGVRYSKPGTAILAYDKTSGIKADIDPSAKWQEEEAPLKHGSRWRNIETGDIRYTQPSAGRFAQVGGEEHTADRLNRAQKEGVGVLPGKGVATSGVEARIMMLATEGGSSLQGEGVLSEIINADKRMLKGQAVALAGKLGMTITSSTSKTAALAHIEHALRTKAGSVPKPGDSPKGTPVKQDQSVLSDPAGDDGARGKGLAESPDSSLSPRGDTPELASTGEPQVGEAGGKPVDADTPGAETPPVVHEGVDRGPGESLKDYMKRRGENKHYKDVAAYARSLHRQAKGQVDEKNAVYDRLAELITDKTGKRFSRRSPLLKDGGDPSQVPGFDEAVDTIADEYPGVFATERGAETRGSISSDEKASNVNKAWGIVKDGMESYPDAKEFEDQAYEESKAGNFGQTDDDKELEGYNLQDIKPGEEVDDSFDFGANVEGTDNEPEQEDTATMAVKQTPSLEAGGSGEGARDDVGAQHAGDGAKAGDASQSPSDGANEPGTTEPGHKQLENSLREEHPDMKLDLSSTKTYDGRGVLRLDRIQLPKEEQGKGRGSAVMRKIIEHADKNGMTIALDPSTDFGASSKSRLEKFYKQFGFSKNKDSSITGAMTRVPSDAKTDDGSTGDTSGQDAQDGSGQGEAREEVETQGSGTPVAAGTRPIEGGETLSDTHENMLANKVDSKGDAYPEKQQSHHRKILDEVDKGGWHTDDDLASSFKWSLITPAEKRNKVATLMRDMVDAGHAQIAWDTEGNPHYAKAGEAMPDHLQGDGKENEFMQQEEAGEHTADDVPGYAGQSFTNDKGLTVDVRKAQDGTWSVGSQTGLTQAGVANALNKMKAEKAKGLFGDDVTAQGDTGKPKEQLQWQEPTKKKDGPELPGMLDAFAPGMFGAAANQAEEPEEGTDKAGGAAMIKRYNKDESSKLAASIRSGDARSKNAGVKSAEIDIGTGGELAHVKMPLSAFTKDTVDFIESSTDAKRVESYIPQNITTPIYAQKKKRGEGFQINDGGHRLMAAVKRGDSHIDALVPVEHLHHLGLDEPAAKSAVRKESGDLPGMRDAFAPGMFGKAVTENDEVSPRGDSTQGNADGNVSQDEGQSGQGISPLPQEQSGQRTAGRAVEPATDKATEAVTGGGEGALSEAKEGGKAQAQAGEEKKPRANAKPEEEGKEYGLEQAEKHLGDMWNEDHTPEQHRANFEKFVANRDSIMADLGKKTGEQLKKEYGVWRAKLKGEMVQEAFSHLQGQFNYSGVISYNPFEEGGYAKAMRAQMEGLKPETIKAKQEERNKHIEEQKQRIQGMVKSLKDPETDEEIKQHVEQWKKGKPVEPGIQKKYDAIKAKETLGKHAEEFKKSFEQRQTVKPVEGGKAGEATFHATKHTKTGDPLYVVQLGNRVERDEYQQHNQNAKRLGGYYSSYRGNGAIPGFTFKDEGQARKFHELVGGAEVKRDDKTAEQVSEEKKDARTSALREKAAGIKAQGNEKIHYDGKENTHKRASHAEGRRADGRRLVARAETMERIADAIEAGEAPALEYVRDHSQVAALHRLLSKAKYTRREKTPDDQREKWEDFQAKDYGEEDIAHASIYDRDLAGGEAIDMREHMGNLAKQMAGVQGYKRMAERFKHGGTLIPKRDVDDVLSMAREAQKRGNRWPAEQIIDRLSDVQRLARAGITNDSTLREALRQYVPLTAKAQAADPIHKAVQAVRFKKKEGFFPTPKALTSTMLDRADIKPGMKVLEPSAGIGSILDHLHEEYGDDIESRGYEVDNELADISRMKGHDVESGDFMGVEPKGEYDRVLMNPPFEKGKDIEHVQKAFEHLKPGGKLVAIMSEGPFFRSDKKAEAFRQWLEENEGESEKMEPGSFKGAEALRETGTNTRMVTITRR